MKSFVIVLYLIFSFLNVIGSPDSTVTYICEQSYEPPTETQYLYNSSGDITHEYIYNIDGNALKISEAINYTYDSNGNLISIVDTSYVNYYLKEITLYTYNSLNFVQSYEISHYNYTSLQYRSHTDYVYDSNGFIFSATLSTGAVLQFVNKTEFFNNVLGKDTIRIKYNWDNLLWDSTERYFTDYLLNDTLITSELFQQYDLLSNSWKNISGDSIQYTLQKKLLCRYDFNFDAQGILNPVKFDTLIYNSSDLILFDLLFVYSGGVRDSSERTTYNYITTNPVKYDYSDESYYGGGWDPYYTGTVSYDTAGHIIDESDVCSGCGSGSISYTYNSLGLMTGHNGSEITHAGDQTYDICDIYYYSINGANAICEGSSITLSADSNMHNYLWSPGGETTRSITVDSAGIYSVEFTDNNGLVWEAAPHHVIIKRPPVASFAPDSSISVCRNGNYFRLSEINLVDNYYQWLVDTNNFGTVNNFGYYININPDIALSGKYRVRVSNECGFDTSSSTIINFSPYFPAQITPANDTTICGGDSILLTGYLANHYLWTYTSDTNQFIYAKQSATYQLLTYDSIGCYDVAEVSITVASNNQGYIFPGSGSTLYAYNMIADYYYWMRNDTIINGSINLNNYSPTIPGNYSLLTSYSGCVDTTSSVFFSPDSILIKGGQDIATCAFSTAYINPQVFNGTPPYNFHWKKNGTLIAVGSGTNLNIGVNDTSSVDVVNVYTIDLTDANGHYGADTINVTFHSRPLPPVITTPPGLRVCHGSNQKQEAILTAEPPGYYFWYKSGNSGSIGSNSNIFSAYQSGTYYAVISNLFCTSNSSNDYILNPSQNNPTITTSVTGFNNNCVGDTVVISATYNSQYTYLWEIMGEIISNSDTNALLVTSSKYYSLNVIDSNGCSNYFNFNYFNFDTAFHVPVFSEIPTVICHGDSVKCWINSLAGYTIQWYESGIPMAGAVDTFVYAKTTGIYSAQLINGIDCNGSSDTVYVQVRPENTITTDFNNNIFTAHTLFTSTYQWYRNGNIIPGANSETLPITQGGIYSIIATDYHGCSNFLDSVTTCGASDSISANTCFNSCDGRIDLNTYGVQPVTVLWGNGSNNLFRDNLCAGQYAVSITDNFGCNKNLLFQISQPTPLAISLPQMHVLNCFGLCDTLSTIISGGTPPYQYLWSDSTTGNNVIACDTGKIDLNIVDSNGCLDSDSISLMRSPVPTSVHSYDAPSCIGCHDGTIIIVPLSGIPPFYGQLNWQPFNALHINDSIIFSQLSSGIFYYTITDSLGCGLNDSIHLLAFPLSIPISDNKNEFDIWPNPFHKNIFIQQNIKQEYCLVVITDSKGAIVKIEQMKEPMLEMETETIVPGRYTLTILTSDKRYIFNIVKE